MNNCNSINDSNIDYNDDINYDIDIHKHKHKNKIKLSSKFFSAIANAKKFNNCLKVLSYDGKDAKNDSRRVHFNENKDWYQPVPELIQLNQIETGSSKQVYTSRNRC